MTLEELAQHRQEILWWEIASLMHDIGKLSDDFLYYRQNWHLMIEGYEKKDPHDHLWYLSDAKVRDEPDGDPRDLGPLRDGMLFKEFPALARFFSDKLIDDAVNYHMELPNENSENPPAKPSEATVRLLRLLKVGDATDSRYDRNNPLAGNEQTQHHQLLPNIPMFRADVFGYEDPDRPITYGELSPAFQADLHRIAAESIENPETAKNLQNLLVRPKFTWPGILDRARRTLYSELARIFKELLPEGAAATLTFDQYQEFRKQLKTYFEPAMSDTTRPCNDTSLWEHVYSVATITKALHARQLIEPAFKPDWSTSGLFRIWGFGFDALRYLSSAHKIGDVLGRRRILDLIFSTAEELIQFEFPLGNCIYRDDNCAFFLVAHLPELLEEMRAKLLVKVNQLSEGELVPHFEATSEPGRNLTGIAKCIQNLRDSLAVPIREDSHVVRRPQTDSGSICPICRLRTVVDNDMKVCPVCLDRRNVSAKEARKLGQTPYLAEIADQNRRTALILAKFGLDDWLNGEMVRTTLITEAHGSSYMLEVLKHFREAKHRDAYTARKSWIADHTAYKYSRMMEEFNRCRDKERDKAEDEWNKSGFLYGRGTLPTDRNRLLAVWDETEEELAHELKRAPSDVELFNAVCAKTATPSTVLDVWETTHEFLKNVTEKSETFSTKEGALALFETVPPLLSKIEGLGTRKRGIVTVSGDCRGLDKHDSFDQASIGGKPAEVIFLGGNRFSVLGKPYDEAWAGKTLSLGTDERALRVSDQPGTDESYKPYRLITASPDLLLLLVPASAAVDVTKALYEKYLKHFGKVYGRLPFSIGNIFFPKHLPMFSVLDAARRMECNFARLHKSPRLRCEFTMPAGIDLKLGDGSPDYYHPYVLTENKDTSAEGFFDTIAGPMVSMRAKPKDALLYPNYYDCEWLGSSADRLRIHVNTIKEEEKKVKRGALRDLLKRPRDGADGPILLDDFRDNVVDLWRKLKQAKISDSHIRNFETLMQDRKKSWQGHEGAEPALSQLAASLIRHYLPGIWEEVTRAYENGFLSLTLTLYLHILKEKLGETNVNRHAASTVA